jgi:hypothetical protein
MRIFYLRKGVVELPFHTHDGEGSALSYMSCHEGKPFADFCDADVKLLFCCII